MTGAAFQAYANLNEQVTDPISHTPVLSKFTKFEGHLLIPMVDTIDFANLKFGDLTPW